jgi:hypothetical protein
MAATSANADTIGGLKDRVAAAVSTPDFATVQQDFAALATDPAFPNLATNLLQTQGPNLTGFQKSLLAAAVIETQYPDALRAALSGQPLTSDQSKQLTSVKAQLHNNDAIQKLISVGAQLKGTSELASDVATATSNLGSTFTPVPPGGGQYLDAVLSDFATLRGSNAYSNFAAAMTPITQDANFIQLVSSASPLIPASFMPGKQLITLLLPNDHDPGLIDIIKDSIGIVGTIVLGVAGVIGVVGSAPAWAIGLTIVGTVLVVSALTIDLLEQIDCDHDGDPWDSNDVVGVEC